MTEKTEFLPHAKKCDVKNSDEEKMKKTEKTMKKDMPNSEKKVDEKKEEPATKKGGWKKRGKRAKKKDGEKDGKKRPTKKICGSLMYLVDIDV